MLSKKQLRNDIKAVSEALKKRNFSFDINQLEFLENQRKKNQINTQELQNLRNMQSKSIGKAKASGEDIKPLLEAVSDLGDQLDEAKSELQNIQSQISDIVMAMPNIPHESVPRGNSEDDNVKCPNGASQGSMILKLKITLI